jgi:hypothetical protein
MTHGEINAKTAEYEVGHSRTLLENTLDMPVRIFCLPSNNDNLPATLAVAEPYGYRAILTIYDAVNAGPIDLFRLGRVPLHTEYPPPFYSAFDPYKRIHQAIDTGGWLIDYAHCPMPGKPIHPHKDCTTQELEERFQTIRRIGGDEVWIAEPNEVVDYIQNERNPL